jgi:hypothetical protein
MMKGNSIVEWFAFMNENIAGRSPTGIDSSAPAEFCDPGDFLFGVAAVDMSVNDG